MNSNDALELIKLLTDDDDLAQSDLRSLMIDIDYADLESSIAMRIRAALIIIQSDQYARESLTDLALQYSLCPLHMIDYAICFDDDDDECRSIRTIHPSHDS